VQRTWKKIKRWRKEYAEGKKTAQEIYNSWQGIDAHMAHANTY